MHRITILFQFLTRQHKFRPPPSPRNSAVEMEDQSKFNYLSKLKLQFQIIDHRYLEIGRQSRLLVCALNADTDQIYRLHLQAQVTSPASPAQSPYTADCTTVCLSPGCITVGRGAVSGLVKVDMVGWWDDMVGWWAGLVGWCIWWWARTSGARLAGVPPPIYHPSAAWSVPAWHKECSA